MARIQINFEGEMCDECGENPKAKCGKMLDGTQKFRAVCALCHRIRFLKPWLKYRGKECEMCEYTPMFSRSLDVHHRDGDKTNNDPDNLMTLCATCHREMEAIISECDGNYGQAESLFKKFMKALIS